MGQDVRVVIPNEFDFLRATSTNRPLPVTGADKLIQIVTKAVLTTPGRDIFNLEYGAGVRDALPRAANQRTQLGALADASIAIMRVEEQIKRNQDLESNTSEERLASLSIRSLTFDTQNGKWELILNLISEAGRAQTFPVIV